MENAQGTRQAMKNPGGRENMVHAATREKFRMDEMNKGLKESQWG